MKKIIFDVFYHEKGSRIHENITPPVPEGCTFGVGLVFNDWSDEVASEVYTDKRKIPAEYIPGQFYKREMPSIVGILEKLNLDEFDTVIVDGLYKLWDNKPGLGQHIYDWLQEKGYKYINVIGIAKSGPRDAEKFATPVLRGRYVTNPLWVNGSQDIDYQELVKSMAGEHRLPALVKLADKLSRGYF